ncbi:MAG: DUF2326 domain-containing protein [Sulfuricurvum sp.]|nr:DUF2326 domain-containing protein [Sulfuricurvum sp.]MDP3022672.1 DUF2326 domain-containing protein [Sulfuricurvum sp.]
MYLLNLIVRSLEVDVDFRDIKFQKGLNLVVDSGKNQKSGNDIGKTTFLRTIDFCLGSMSNELYLDRDEQRTNKEVKKFLVDQKICFILSLGYSFEEPANIVLVRWFTGKVTEEKPEIKQSINGKEYSISKYTEELNRIMFGIFGKPYFRDLIPKFIREEKNSTGSLLRFHGKFKSDEEYNSIHLSLFGFSEVGTLGDKSQLTKTVQEYQNKLKVYVSDYGKKNTLRSAIAIKEKEFETLITERDNLQLKIADIRNLKSDLDELNRISKRIVEVNSEIIKFEIDVRNIKKSISRLTSELADVDEDIIELLYKEIKIYNSAMHKDFTETLHFHNKMIKNKVAFSQKSLDFKEQQLAEMIAYRDHVLVDYSAQKAGADNELFMDLNNLNNQLLEVSNELTIKQNALETIDKLNIDIAEYEEALKKVVDKIKAVEATIQDNINIFNVYFSAYTKRLYNEEYYIFMDDSILKPFEVSTKFNPGDGKKKAVITAFDIAYTSFLSATKIGYPKFIAEDQMELIDVSQLEALFAISNEVDCQLIIPVLKSKIERIDGLSEHEILVLSEEDKFFRF